MYGQSNTIKGQYTIFDIHQRESKRKPCEYSFERYIGQKVFCRGQVCEIIEIEKYYTILSGDMVGTPTTIYPVNEEE